MATKPKEPAKDAPKDGPKEGKKVTAAHQIVFNTSKEELGNPARNMKKFKDILKDSHKVGGTDQCALNKDEIKYDKIKGADVLIFPGPTKKFTHAELTDLERYLEDGKHVFLMADEGGEDGLGSNFNFLLEKYNMLANGDSVIRTAYFKYFHPKEVFVQHGVVDEDFVRVANRLGPQAGMKKHKRTALAFEGEAEDGADSGLAGFHFVYPHGCTLTVKSPALPLITSGPISYPVNQPVGAYAKTKRGGVLLVLGSYKFLSDDYIDKEENAKFVVGHGH
jgi:intraflagellar transport protein 52